MSQQIKTPVEQLPQIAATLAAAIIQVRQISQPVDAAAVYRGVLNILAIGAT